ncbi:transcriptional regulator GcvA [Phenylobacterium sp.]|uniref:transcriptional regulator GcvA n=1 Tax=Phenylobacterium sp. TaxID=1871053 RepID=UPI002DF181E8|nr:transcriptional regulator GcvA [Phenylobacterium sp.]
MVRLPPFFALRALEAAARHRSYSRAAQELTVTHGAVSQQIRKLEAELGARLFERRGNAMEPTPEALRLAQEVARGVAILREAVADFSCSAECDPLVISMDPQFATRWLPARLARLLADPAGANLELRSEERRADLTTDGVDVAIRYGGGHWAGLETTRLFTETLFPVCSPKLANSHPIRRPQDLQTAPLVHSRHRPWSLWFDAFGLEAPPQRGPVVDDSLVALEAAAEGMGVALARSGLIAPDLASGRLVRVLETELASEFGFFVVWRADSRKLPRIRALRDWLTAEVRASEPREAATA